MNDLDALQAALDQIGNDPILEPELDHERERARQQRAIEHWARARKDAA
jgi:hypothetical protein